MEEILSRNIKNIRSSMDLSLEEFGRNFFNISKHAVQKWESGVNKPSNKNVQKLSRISGIKADDLKTREINDKERNVIQSFYLYTDFLKYLSSECKEIIDIDKGFIMIYDVFFIFNHPKAVFNGFDVRLKIKWEKYQNNLLEVNFEPSFNSVDKSFLRDHLDILYYFIHISKTFIFEKLLYDTLNRISQSISSYSKEYSFKKLIDYGDYDKSLREYRNYLENDPLKYPSFIIKGDKFKDYTPLLIYFPSEFFISKNYNIHGISGHELFKKYWLVKYDKNEKEYPL